MRVRPKRLWSPAQLQLTVDDSPQYRAPDRVVTTIKKLTLMNVSASDVVVTIYLVPYGEAAGTSNSIWYQVTVPADDGTGPVDVPDVVNQVLEEGDMIQMLADTADVVNALASGIEVSTS